MEALNHTCCIASAKIARRKSVPAKMLVGGGSRGERCNYWSRALILGAEP